MREIDVLLGGASQELPPGALAGKLREAEKAGRKLRVKLGLDPTAPDLHLGHTVVLRKLKDFQDFGHKIILVVGGFTARIGDPTGRNKTRPPLTEDQVRENAKTYLSQFSKVVDISQAEIHDNSDWLHHLSLGDVVRLTSTVTVAQLLQRTDFEERFRSETPIGVHELLYPLLQAYDSVAIRADVELGGNDQLFNCATGRIVQEAYGQSPQVVLCTPLLVGTDAREKMSKSAGNYVALNDAPPEMYAKIMSIPDSILTDYVRLVLPAAMSDRNGRLEAYASGMVSPYDLKHELAAAVVRSYHSSEAAMAASRLFRERFQQRDFNQKAFDDVDVKTLPLSHARPTVLELGHLLVPSISKSQLRQLIREGAVVLDGERVTDVGQQVDLTASETRIRIGRRGYFRLTSRS